jgi:voltage-dependent anion channel protein 2
MSSSAFVPPLFSKLGTSAKDLLTKKYDYKNSVGTKNNQNQDLSIESVATIAEGFDVSGNVKLKHKNKDIGEFEGEFNTKGTLTGELKATKLHEGFTVILKGTEKPTGKIGVEYKREALAASLSTEANFSGSTTAKIEATAVAGVDGFSVGGQSSYDTNKSVVDDYNFGAEYSEKDYTLTLKTAKKADEVIASYFHNLPSKSKLRTQVGGQFSWCLNSDAKVLTLGSEHDVDDTTTVKAKIDTNGSFATAIEHRLANPALKVALSSQWDGKKKSFSPKDFGVALTFGDF